MKILQIFLFCILYTAAIIHAAENAQNVAKQTIQSEKKKIFANREREDATGQDSKTPITQEATQKQSLQEPTLADQIDTDYARIQTPPKHSKTLDIRAFFSSFKLNEPWYVLPAYYSFSDMYSDTLIKTEIKAQISFRFELLSDVLCKFCALSFDYTQKIYLQTYNDPESAPLRDTDLSPAISFVYKRPLLIADGKGGMFNWFSIGYRHTSNGERENKYPEDPRQDAWGGQFVRSKAYDRVMLETNYRYNDFNARIRAWVNISALAYDGAKTNGDIDKYMGYGDLRLSYVYKNNLFELYINNIFNNYFTKEYWNWKGQVELGYSYGVTKHYAIYVQYLYGHGDSLYEYSLPVNRIGIGVRLRDF